MDGTYFAIYILVGGFSELYDEVALYDDAMYSVAEARRYYDDAYVVFHSSDGWHHRLAS